MTCKGCGAALERATAKCPACGAPTALAALVGSVGLVCPACDAYNELTSDACAACGAALAGPPAEAVPGEAQQPAVARLVVERGEVAPGTAYPLGDGETPAGRGQALLQFAEDPCLAPLHATFSVRDDAVVVRDEGAAGGVFVRVRAASVPLRPGTLFAAGDRLLRYGGLVPPAPPLGPDGTRRLGAPRPEGPAIVVEEWLEAGISGRAWIRSGRSVTIGGRGCTIELADDPFVAPAHAAIELGGDGAARLRDLGSSDGTFVRIPPGAEQELGDGDAVRLGREVLRVELGSAR